MSWRAVGGWFGASLVLVIGLGFLVAAIGASADADAYRRTPQCAEGTGAGLGNCYELRPGVITSVDVSTSRSGEHDAVVIDTGDSVLRTTLEPSAGQAPHVRTAARVSVKIYRGTITTVFVDNIGVPTSANPARNQDFYRNSGMVFTLLGLVMIGFRGYPLLVRRRRGAAGGAETADLTPGAGADTTVVEEVLPSGAVGAMARPRVGRSMAGRLAVLPLLLLFLTFRGLFYPNLAPWIWGVDATLLLVAGLYLLRFLRTARVFGSREGIGRVDALGRQRIYPPGEVAGATRFGVSTRYGSTPYMAFVDGSGRQVFKVAGLYWDTGELEAVASAAGIPVTGSFADVISPYSMNKKVPGSVNWPKSILVAVVVIGAIIPLVLLLNGPSHR